MNDDNKTREQLIVELQQLRRELATPHSRDGSRAASTLDDDGFLLNALLDSMPDYIFFKDTDHRFVKLNAAHSRLMGHPDPQTVIGKTDFDLFPREMAEFFYAEEQRILAGEPVINRVVEVSVNNQQLWIIENKLPLRDPTGKIVGIVGIARNIDALKQAEEALREREASLKALVEDQEILITTVRDLATPVLPVYNEILVLPLVGSINSARSTQVMEMLLTAIQSYQADMVIIDISGVPVVDTAVANHLIQTTRAASLLGAQCVLVGVAPEVAQTMVQLGIDLEALVTRRNLQDGLEYALAQHKLRIV